MVLGGPPWQGQLNLRFLALTHGAASLSSKARHPNTPISSDALPEPGCLCNWPWGVGWRGAANSAHWCITVSHASSWPDRVEHKASYSQASLTFRTAPPSRVDALVQAEYGSCPPSAGFWPRLEVQSQSSVHRGLGQPVCYMLPFKALH